MTDPEVLHGGFANEGQVARVGDHVIRPANPHSRTVHALLRHLRAVGFEGASEPVAVEGDRERLVFVPGDVSCPPHQPWARSGPSLASVAHLLRRYHDAAETFVPPPDATWSDEMADPSGVHEVVCHNDVCLENVVFRDGHAVALLDFDFAAPGRRMWGLASFARMCIPLEAPEDGGPPDPFTALRQVADAYGRRDGLLDAVGRQMASTGEFVRRRMERGEPAFARLWEQTGGAARYERRRAWFAANRLRFEAALA